jgi:hypothetical protein
LAWWAPGIWVLASLAPLDCAHAQNLDAGKSAAQLFTEACSGCHRSPREVRGNTSAGFLREHYTTSGDMASTMANYLAGFGDPRAPAAAQPKQKSAPATASRDTPVEGPRRVQQGEPKAQQAEPKASPAGGANRSRPAASTAASTNEAKLPNPSPPAPNRPVLEEFEE